LCPSIFQIFMESSKIPLIMYLKKKHLPSGRKEKNRCWADPFSRLIYIHWWRFWEIKAAAFFLSFPAVKGMAAHGRTPPCCFTIIII
ncbi:hypothetical protein, partial [Flavonifractor plautii]|uniref:hypothetical protein n=1 Tax=Flavonifractor plautii TaxID=292800 RepID=UPI001A9AFE63